MSVMCSRPSIPPISTNAPYSVRFLTDSGQDAALFQMLKRLAAFLRLLFFQKLLARDHDVAALFIELDDGDFHGLALHAIEIADGTQIDLRTWQKGACAMDVDGQSALDAFDDNALDRLLFVVSALNLIPRAQPLRLQVREVDIALFGFALFAHYVDLVAGLELRLALVIENLRDRNHAFGLGSDIDDHMGRGQFHYAAFDDVVLADGFLGFGLEALQGRGKVIAGSCRGLGDGSRGNIVFRSFALRSGSLSSSLWGSVILLCFLLMRVRLSNARLSEIRPSCVIPGSVRGGSRFRE